MANKSCIVMSNAVHPAAPASVWGKGVPGKSGKSTNYRSTEEKKTEKEKE